MAAFRGAGRRLADGAEVAPPPPAASTQIAYALVAVGLAVAVATCPTHDGFEEYLTAASAHPSKWIGTLSAMAERLRVSITAESHSYLLFRTGCRSGKRFVGAFGTWVALPAVPEFTSLAVPDFSVCRHADSAPHELFAMLCLATFVLMSAAPRFGWRHCSCSLSALRAGRLWTLLSSNMAHGSVPHLANNLMQILNLGPMIHAAIGCERALGLLACACLASSLSSVFWHGVLGGRAGAGSIGASGVAMALVAANAALFPSVGVRMYGVELSAHHLPLAYLLLDAFSARGQRGEVDLSSHVGGALAGWVLAQRWKPWYL